MPSFQSLQIDSSPIAAADQYIQWATDLGVSTTATLMDLDGDDMVWAFELASPCLAGGATHAEFCSEGMVGWSGSPKLNRPVGTDFSRMFYDGSIQPDKLWAFRFNANCSSVGVKLQKAAGVTILGGTITSTSVAPQTLDFAVRFSSVLLEAPQVIVTVKAGGWSAQIGAAKVPTGALNFSTASVAADQTVSASAIGTPINNVRLVPSNLGLSFGTRLAPPATRVVTPIRRVKDIYYGGADTIQGVVTIENIPGSRRVRLFDKSTGLFIKETWSSATGEYTFSNLDGSREYFVVAHDHLRLYNAVVQDMLVP